MMLREPWRSRLLLMSFAINLVTIPIAAAPLILPRPGALAPPVPGGPPRPAVQFERMTRALSPEDRDKMRQAMEPHFDEIDIARLRMDASRSAMLRAIGRSPYDPQALRTAMGNWQTAWKAWSDDFGVAFLDGLQSLSDEGRQRLAEAGRRHPPR